MTIEDMTIGFVGIQKPEDMKGRPLEQCSRLYFSGYLLWNPHAWIEVALPSEEEAHAWLSTMCEFDDDASHALIKRGYDAVRKGETWDGWFLWPRGTRVTAHPQKDDRRKLIWVLTGRHFPLTQTTAYEAKWPD